jgi:hypothetical protein
MVDKPLPPHEAEPRRIYQEILQFFPEPDRMEMARTVEGRLLKAMCFEPSYRVILALIDNMLFGMIHARLVAKYHHSEVGLEKLTRVSNFVSDHAVQAGLFRNRASSKVVLNRAFSKLTLFRLHNIAAGQEASEHVMMQARDALRIKFEQSSPEQRAYFIITTEGRCLRFFYRIKLGPETSEILGAHKFSSFILVRNLLVFPGLPAVVIRGMAKSLIIWRNPEFRRRILGHTNCPYDVKRKGGYVK